MLSPGVNADLMEYDDDNDMNTSDFNYPLTYLLACLLPHLFVHSHTYLIPETVK